MTEATEYRRLVIEPNISPRRSASSNVVRIYPTSYENVSNTICCDQIVNNNTVINEIIGNSSLGNPFFSGGSEIQWQVGYFNNLNKPIIW